MASTQVPIGLNKQDANDLNWHTALNAGIDAANTRLTLHSVAGNFDPNGIEIGRWRGQRYFEMTSVAWWVFKGTVDTNTGWVREMPRGLIMMWTGTVPPDGWVLCNGTLHVQTGYTPPDLRGRFIVGYDPGDADYNVIGDVGGEKTHVLTVAEMPSHDHGGATGLATDGIDMTTYNDGSEADRVRAGGPNAQAVTGDFPDHTHTISSQGSGTAHENRPPFYTLAYVAKL